jgi:hypothetical protein
MTARMFDYPATPNERAVTRRNNERHQLAMFDQLDHTEPASCPVCAGTHTEAECTHGTAPTLPDTRNPSNPAQVRAMFRSLGWPTQGD